MCQRSLNSFTGVIEEIPCISIDNFTDYNKAGYFLSHCHTDHTHGLFLTEFIDSLERNNASVYMSEASAAIVEYEALDMRIVKFIKSLKLGRSTITLKHCNDKEIVLNTTLIPAGHCFGSVMFLFAIQNKHILYTGDFRVDPNDISKYAHLHKHGEIITINTLYVDTTFQSCAYQSFPKRTESVQFVVEAIRKWLGSEGTKVALHTSAKYGYEFLYNEIYKCLGLKVQVNETKWGLYRNHPTLVPGVTNVDSKIHLCMNRSEKTSHDSCVPNIGPAEYLYIHLSAMMWTDHHDERRFYETKDNRLNVCFATHCSRSELMYFVEYLSPKRIVGFREPYALGTCEKTKQDMEFVSKKRKIVPKVGLRKVDSGLLKEMFEI